MALDPTSLSKLRSCVPPNCRRSIQNQPLFRRAGDSRGFKPLSWLALEGGNTDTSAERCSPTPHWNRCQRELESQHGASCHLVA